jgi:hypothetical protein
MNKLVPLWKQFANNSSMIKISISEELYSLDNVIENSHTKYQSNTANIYKIIMSQRSMIPEK